MTRKTRDWLAIASVAALAAAAGFAYNVWRTTPEPGAVAVAALTSARFANLDGATQSLEEWRGKVVVVNFWATWCAPCREEIPAFVKLQDRYRAQGLQFVGIAIDHPDKVRPYAAELKMNFPILIGGIEAIDLTRALGNRAGVLPFTVILRRDGQIAAKETGATQEAKLEALILPLL